MGNLAWVSIINQFIPVLVNKTPLFLRPNQYVYMNFSAFANVKVGFIPNFENPDPSHFPNMNLTINSTPRSSNAESKTEK
jgi:hypothetical protein